MITREAYNNTPFRYQLNSYQLPDKVPILPDQEYIQYLIETKKITENEIDIIRIVANTRFATTSQIRRLTGTDIDYNAKFKNKLHLLYTNRILYRFSWTLASGTPSIMKGFALDAYGYKILKDWLNEDVNWNIEQNSKPMEDVFAQFELNEIYDRIRYSKNYLRFAAGENLGTGTAYMQSKTGSIKEYNFIVLRFAPYWQDKFKNQLKEYYNQWVRDMDKGTVTIMVGEDVDQIEKISDIIKQELQLPEANDTFKLKYTIDEYIANYPFSEAICNINYIGDVPEIQRVRAEIFE